MLWTFEAAIVISLNISISISDLCSYVRNNVILPYVCVI